MRTQNTIYVRRKPPDPNGHTWQAVVEALGEQVTVSAPDREKVIEGAGRALYLLDRYGVPAYKYRFNGTIVPKDLNYPIIDES